MYDYDAAEDNELTFREGDYITNIEVIDDGWYVILCSTLIVFEVSR